MSTARIHAELIAAFFGDEEPRYGECECGPCRSAGVGSSPFGRTTGTRAAATRPDIAR